ncbi:vacuolar protein sorting-associated protein 16 homolog [Hyalella azteca]|uniref:Vacuolar protein sorting-associated protein 16 homolog n=1 Tax=Hyalella azteca TaxID=294128 RepID=A0A8B7NZB2_HYAAZ|nr:vacuolar protein sorting-associated protein 16 homolog [Hyalella azteca]
MAQVSDWTRVGNDVFYRKAELYTMEWGGGINVEEVLLSGAPYGGPIALTWLQEGRTKHRAPQSPATPTIVIFSAAGVKMGIIKWGNAPLIAMGWTLSEDLLCVQQDGAVSMYDMFGNYKQTFNMGPEAKDTGILSAKVFEGIQGTGVAVLTATHRLYVIANVAEPNPRKYADFPSADVSCWTVLREERALKVLLCQHDVLCWSSAANTRADVVQAPHVTEGVEDPVVIVKVSVSSNQRCIALLSATGKLWLGSSDLLTRFTLHDTRSNVCPRHLAWCGSGSVVLVWEVTLQLVDITGSVATFYLDSPVHVVQELDCVRLVGDTSHHILYKVPHASVETLGIGSMSPGALLVEAHLGYEEESPRAYDCLKLIQGKEEEAVHTCLEAARHDMSVDNVKLLLKSSLFGLTFLPPLEPNTFKDTALKLRILNDLRSKKIGMPLTWQQLERLTLEVALERLVARRFFPVALAIARTLGLETQLVPRILAHWACYKIANTSDKNDEQLARDIHSKLGYTAGISYTEIANCAHSLNRRQLAVKLLGYECRARAQVTGLLRLEERAAALARAQATGDTDLILTVLLDIKRALPLGEFLMVVGGSPLCRAVYARSCAAGAQEALRDLYVQDDNFHEQARLRLLEAYDNKRTDLRLGLLQSTAECFRRAKDELGVQLTEEQMRLLKCQVGLEELHHKSYVNLSLVDTLMQLIRDNHIKDAEKIRADFKITEKRYWYLRVTAHAAANHWQALEQFVKSKKTPPIGYEFVVDACLNNNSQSEAKKYVDKVKDENKAEYLRKCGLVSEAEKFTAESTSSVLNLARVTGFLS